MSAKSKTPKSETDGRQNRGDATRRKLLDAAIVEFGRLGIDGASTRKIAEKAGVNLQAITYYFGDKEGLYLASAQHITDLVKVHVGDLPERIADRLHQAEQQSQPIGKAEARMLLTEIAQTMARLFVGKESDAWANFVIHEQAFPTEAFKVLYGGVMQPMLEVAERLLSIILAEPVGSEHLRLRLLSLVGSILVFRTARGAIKAQLGWSTLGKRESAAIVDLAAEILATIDNRGSDDGDQSVSP